jgi:hypothetical protein
MPIEKAPPLPPRIERSADAAPGEQAPIADMREQFARKTPQTAEDRERARAFIDGKIEMLRRDPHLSDAEKAAAISELEAKRQPRP